MTEAGRIVLDGRRIGFQAGDSVAIAALRAGEHPGHGGTICLAGDCGNCVAEVDGIAWTRTCQVPARPGLVIRRHPAAGAPPLRAAGWTDVTDPPTARRIPVQRSQAQVVVVGAGESGSAAEADARRQGRSVTLLDGRDGLEVVAVYAGPTVIVRTPGGMAHIDAEEVIVATGAAELQPVCPGDSLIGLVTAGAAERLHAAGVDLGVTVAVGSPPRGVPCTPLSGDLRRIDGDGRVSAVVTVEDGEDGDAERTTPCDTVILGLGRTARDVLARMAGDLPVTVVGPAAESFPLPAAPAAGTICPCSRVGVDDLAGVWERGFRDLELIKRATLAGTGTCE